MLHGHAAGTHSMDSGGQSYSYFVTKLHN
jgi:hypothetical protein